MRKFTLFIVLVFHTIALLPQERSSVDIYVDPKMAMMTDEHGNIPFTLNGLVHASIHL